MVISIIGLFLGWSQGAILLGGFAELSIGIMALRRDGK